MGGWSTGTGAEPGHATRLLPPVAQALLVAVVLSGAVVALTSRVDPAAWLTPEGLRAALGVGTWYAPLGYVATLVAGIFLPVPKLVLLGLGGALFGPWQGFVYAWAGQTLGMTAMFLVARSGLRGLARQLLHDRFPHVRRLDAGIAAHGMRVVALLRLFYFMGTPLTVMLSTTQVRLGQYVGGTALGVIPAVALAVVSGDAVVSGVTGVEAAVIGVAILLVIGVGTIVRRRFGL